MAVSIKLWIFLKVMDFLKVEKTLPKLMSMIWRLVNWAQCVYIDRLA